MKYYNNPIEIIGNTPLIKLNNIAKQTKPLLLAKVEYFNPGGSVKDRIGIAMVEHAEKKGLLKKGGTIVEPTSGNTGVGLALVAALKGYNMIFVMPDKMSKEKEWLLKAYGAEVVRTPTNVEPDDPQSYYKAAEKITHKTPGAFCPNQYYNQINPKTHYKTTGPEIWRDTNGKITHFVAGIGTGGTISGVGKYLKKKNKNIKIIGVDPEGSLFHPTFYKTGKEFHPYKIEGIGEDFIPETTDLNIIDEIVAVSDKDAFTITRKLARKQGLLVGGSSGAAVWAGIQIAQKLSSNDVIVVLLPDTGRNYLSTIFNDDWMHENGFLPLTQ